MTHVLQMTAIAQIDDDIRAVVATAREEGFAFMDRLIEHWDSGANRFDRAGERYYGVRQGGRLIGLGGLNRDPYTDEADVGRIRHVYIVPEARRSGAGTALMAAILSAARDNFTLLRVRTNTDRGALFYQSLGFERSDAPDASHVMRI